MPTPEEIQAKSDATRLKNLLAKKADKKPPLSKWEESLLRKLKANAKKAKTPRKERRDFSQIALAVVEKVTGSKLSR